MSTTFHHSTTDPARQAENTGRLVVARISVRRPRTKNGLGPPTITLLEITDEDPSELLDRAAKILAETIPREEILSASATEAHTDPATTITQAK